MSTDMVEKVARVACELHHFGPRAEGEEPSPAIRKMIDGAWPAFVPLVRALIHALGEPTPSMLRKIRMGPWGEPETPQREQDLFELGYRRGIDAALAGTPTVNTAKMSAAKEVIKGV